MTRKYLNCRNSKDKHKFTYNFSAIIDSRRENCINNENKLNKSKHFIHEDVKYNFLKN